MRTIQGVNVCVVGGAGFLGSHCVDHLINDRECEVLVIDNLITGKLKNVHPKANFEYADITQSESYLLKLFKHHKIQYVVNWAAEPYIPVSFERPLHVFDINAMGALKVINAAQEAECKGICQISSAEIYGAGQHGTYRVDNANDWGKDLSQKLTEDAVPKPHSTYGVSKLAIDNLVQVRWKEAQTPCLAVRLFNCIAEREGRPYVAPEIISQLSRRCKEDTSGAAGIPIIRLGNNSFRDFQYGPDAVKAIVELMEKGSWGEVYNLGFESGIKIYDLAKLIGKLMGFGEIEIEVDQKRIRPQEIWHLQSDNTKINSVINYRPKSDLKDALCRTIKFFHENGNKWGWE